ncbi:hypothetical protein BC835DRAFT_1422870 [Cytidiella melzeri]|nr:hypothetical protein BC835DRAFT_1422870 [Cytidiella melzeri]
MSSGIMDNAEGVEVVIIGVNLPKANGSTFLPQYTGQPQLLHSVSSFLPLVSLYVYYPQHGLPEASTLRKLLFSIRNLSHGLSSVTSPAIFVDNPRLYLPYQSKSSTFHPAMPMLPQTSPSPHVHWLSEANTPDHPGVYVSPNSAITPLI